MIVLFALIRALHFASLMIVFGASAFCVLGSRSLDLAPTTALRRFWLLRLSVVALVTAVLCLFLVTGQMTGDWTQSLSPTRIITVLGKTFYGRVFLVRALLLLGVCWLLWSQKSLGLSTVAAALALGLLGLVSHAAANAGSWRMAMAANDALHVLCAGFWVGALTVLAQLMWAKSSDLVAALRLFSRWAIGLVALLVGAGFLNGYVILNQHGMTDSVSYLGWLAAKLVLAALMIALALTNRFGIVPGLIRGEPEARESLTLTVIMEIGCAILIILVVGFLGETAPMAM